MPIIAVLMEQRGKVLVVDDEPDIRLMLRITLQLAGYEVLQAGDGVEALEKIEREHPDAMILDLRMPQKDGWQVLEELSEAGLLNKLPVIVLSAYTDAISRERAMGHGCVAFIDKPPKGDELMQALAVAVA